MSDETGIGSAGALERPSILHTVLGLPLYARVAFLKDQSWGGVIGLNQTACARGNALHGFSQSATVCRRAWEENQAAVLTFGETIEFLRRCHRRAPFLFFNEDTFADVGRQIAAAAFTYLPRARLLEVISATAHYIADIQDPSVEEAKALPFGELARIIRAHLGGGLSWLETEASKEQVREWIAILESKIPHPPQEPQAFKLPEPPKIPTEPVVEEPHHSPSPEYEASRAHYEKLIAEHTAEMIVQLWEEKHEWVAIRIAEMQAAEQKALLEAKLADLPKETASRWLEQRTEHQRWQGLKRNLLGNHMTRVKSIERQNRARQEIWLGQMNMWRRSNELPLRILHNLRHDFDDLMRRPEQMAITRLPWRFLPPSETGEERVLSALHHFHQRRPEVRVDESRLRYAYSLKPEQIFIGEDEFDGYFAFVFVGGVRVLLENPIEGNAAYIFGQDWRLLSKLSKSELLAYHRDHLIRVVHSSRWKSEVLQALHRFGG
jgi:hypothetical protein